MGRQNFKVKMRGGGMACLSDEADFLERRHPLSFFHENFFEMRVARRISVGMLDGN